MAKSKNKVQPRPKKSDQDEETEPLTNFQDTTVRAIAEKKIQKEKPAAVKKAVTTIDKIKVVDKNFLMVGFSRIETDGSTSSHPGEAYEGRFIHPDTHSIFKSLRIHWAILCGYLSTKKVPDVTKYNQDLVETVVVTGVTIKPEEGFQIHGHKITEMKKAAIVNTPYTLFQQDEKSSYRYAEEVRELIEQLVEESLLYISGKKVGEDPQGKLDFPEKEPELAMEEA